MAMVQICDASGRRLAAHEAREVPWGYRRVYGEAAWPAVEAYLAALDAAAERAREVFADGHAAAQAVFHAAWPEGLLPDEPPGDGLAGLEGPGEAEDAGEAV